MTDCVVFPANKAYWLEEELLALRNSPIAISQKQSHHDGKPSLEMELLLRPDSRNLALTSNEKLAVDDNGWQIPPPEIFQPLEQDNTLHGQDVMAPKAVKYSPLAAKGNAMLNEPIVTSPIPVRTTPTEPIPWRIQLLC